MARLLAGKKRKLFSVCVSVLAVSVWLYITDFVQNVNNILVLQSPNVSHLFESGAHHAKVQFKRCACKAFYVGCFNPIQNFLPLEESSTRSDLHIDACYEGNSKLYYVSLQNGSILSGVQIAREYVINNKLLPYVDEKKCSKQHAYPIFKQSYPCDQGSLRKSEFEITKACLSTHDAPTVNAGSDLNSTSCRELCYHLDFLLYGTSKEGNCICTFSNLQSKTKKSESSNCEREINLWHTHALDKRCLQKIFLPANTLPPIALISFPGSGNSWTRHLIESLTGIYSGSIYKDKGMYQKGYLGEYLEWNSGKTVVIKSHKPHQDRRYAKIILLVRNPFDAIMAEYNRIHGGQTGYADEKEFLNDEWKTFVQYKIKKWAQTCFSYIEDDVPLLLLYYESLLLNPQQELRKLSNWINITISNFNERFTCTLNNMEGFLHRKQRKLSFDPFNENITTVVNTHVENVRLLVRKYHLPEMPQYEKAIY